MPEAESQDMTERTEAKQAEETARKVEPIFKLLDAYTAFSAELTRLAFLGLAGAGFFLNRAIPSTDEPQKLSLLRFSTISLNVLLASCICFVLSATMALLYRYMMARNVDNRCKILTYIASPYPPFSLIESELKKIFKADQIRMKVLGVSVGLLIAGAVCLAFNFGVMINHK